MNEHECRFVPGQKEMVGTRCRFCELPRCCCDAEPCEDQRARATLDHQAAPAE